MSQKNINFFPYGRGNLGRMPTFSQVDLLMQQELPLPKRMRATIGLNAINVFDQKTVTGYQTTPYRDQFNVSDATFFGGFDPAAVATAAELPQGRALQHGQRIPGRPGDSFPGASQLLTRAFNRQSAIGNLQWQTHRQSTIPIGNGPMANLSDG